MGEEAIPIIGEADQFRAGHGNIHEVGIARKLCFGGARQLLKSLPALLIASDYGYLIFREGIKCDYIDVPWLASWILDKASRKPLKPGADLELPKLFSVSK